MTTTVVKIAVATLLALSIVSPAMATTESAVTTTVSLDTKEARAAAASLCAADLAPKALNIFDAVSPKVDPDSNLRKLVKKHVRPKVISGKLSIKSARKNAEAASVCLRILKHGSAATG